ncbi:hypothetical protein B5S30_g4921 [[Candida] boidinii]|nr:hypothetical protein B5S30_g4921 [[Candida] boidinii]
MNSSNLASPPVTPKLHLNTTFSSFSNRDNTDTNINTNTNDITNHSNTTNSLAKSNSDTSANTLNDDENSITDNTSINPYWSPQSPANSKFINHKNHNNNQISFSNTQNSSIDSLKYTSDSSNWSPSQFLDTPVEPIASILPLPIPSSSSSSSSRRKRDNSKIELPDYLKKYELSPNVFNIKINELLGKGACSYVCNANLISVHNLNDKLNIAIKIPSTKSKSKSIIKELEIINILKNYHQSSYINNTNNTATFSNLDNFPFIECLGVYYINKNLFNLLKPNDNLPCLILKKMDTDLVKLLEILLPQNLGNNSIIIGNKNFWKLAKILIEGLIILQKINYIHCDLKSLNILVNLNNHSEEEIEEEDINNNLDFEFKIIDFTSAISVNELNESTKLPDMTIQFTAPELINLNSKTLPSINTDLFSIGLILLHASIGLPPYYNINTPYHLIDLVSNLKVFDILERESINILDNNLIIKELLIMIIIKRSNLNDVIDYFNKFNEINCKI